MSETTWTAFGFGIASIGCTVLFNFIANRWKRRIDSLREDRKSLSVAEITERSGLIANWEILVRSLQARLDASETEHRTVRALFQEMQVALVACQRSHQILETQNIEQAAQIAELQHRADWD